MSGSIERITKINDNDIICGRRGVALKHPGNISYRKMVGLNKERYATCLKNEKLRVSKGIVEAMREAGGRFLEREDGKTSNSLEEHDEHGNPVVWRDIGDKRAVEKTSQALREGQPKLLQKLAQKNQNANCQPVLRYHAYAMNPSAAQNYNSNVTQTQIVTPQAQMVTSQTQIVTPKPQASTPPPPTPPSTTSVLSHILQQCDTDLLLLALLVDKMSRRK